MLKKSPFSCLKRSSLKKTPFKKKKNTADEFHEKVVAIEKMRTFFMSIWRNCPHYCTVCGKGLGSEPLSYMFHHVVPKQRQKNYSIDITYDENNTIIVCLDCHSVIEGGNETPAIKRLKSDLLKYYDEHRIP